LKTENVTTHGGIALVMDKTLSDYGCDAAAIFAKAGLESGTTLKHTDRVAAIAMQKVWRFAVAETGDQGFGIRFALNTHPMTLHGLGFSWMASDTLHDAFLRLVRYYRLISSAGAIVLDDDAQHYRLWYQIPGPVGAAAPASLDAALAVFVQLCRLTKSPDFKPSKVELQRPVPNDCTRFDAFFRCPIAYQSEENCLYFDKNELDAPLLTANPELARANDQVVMDYLKQFDQQDIVNRIRANLIEVLPSGAPSQDKIADSLNMSTRSMQRRLQEHDTSFKQLLEDLRAELASSYLQDSGRNIGEVTYLLGFSEPSNFTRSFKRWTGMTPAEYQTSSQL
jgi:AraC-like DNA-binding protein